MQYVATIFTFKLVDIFTIYGFAAYYNAEVVFNKAHELQSIDM